MSSIWGGWSGVNQTNDVTPEGKPAAETSLSEVNFGSACNVTKLYQKLEKEE